MSADSRPPTRQATTRADIARLTLRSRTARREADEAEAASPDSAAAVQELEARLAHLLDERRTALQAEVARVRAEADQVIADARHRAAELVERELAARSAAAAAAAAAMSVAPAAPPAPPAPPAPVAPPAPPAPAAVAPPPVAPAPIVLPDPTLLPDAAMLPEPEPVVSATADPIVVLGRSSPYAPFAPGAASAAEPDPWAAHAPGPDAWAADPRFADSATSDAARSAVPISSVEGQPGFPNVVGPVPPMQAITVVIDAEAFARVFANTVSKLVGERAPQPAPYALPLMQHMVPPPVVNKQSFWASARHLDVMLLGVTTVIVLVILAAWLV